MNAKEFLKPNIFKILTFIFIGIFYLYFAGESVCGVSFLFAFCYKAYGFPFLYLITGDINDVSGYVKTLFLGKYFSKFGNLFFNLAALVLDIVLIYLLACLMSMIFNKKNVEIEH